MTESNGNSKAGDEPNTAQSSAALVALAAEIVAEIGGASLQLLGSPIASILGAAAVPVIQRLAAKVFGERADKFGKRLRDKGISAEDLFDSITSDPKKFDLFREALSAATESDNDSKRRVLADVLSLGILTHEEAVEAYARRVIQSLARIDTLEILTLGALDSAVSLNSSPSASGVVRVMDIMSKIDLQRRDMLEAGVAVLQAEGLITPDRGVADGWRITDYGRRLISEIRQVETTGD